ncbi:YeeE/YedE family protein [Thermus sp.]|uniref:YeeE/YedE family protein n=1 Tax=Thermus sp. TaxID=275 RepID=UPI00307D0C97
MTRRLQPLPLLTFGLLALALSWAILQAGGLRLVLAFWLGVWLGLALFHARFGFASGFRRFLLTGESRLIRAHFLLFALTATLFAPFLATGMASGFVAPMGVGLLVGAFLFGVGMQLGDGCASGTLYHTGSGDTRGLFTLLGFMVGSLLGVFHLPYWQSLPKLAPGSALEWFQPLTGPLLGAFLGYSLWMALLLGLYLLVARVERVRRGRVEPLWGGQGHPLLGPWSLGVGALALALGSLLTLLLLGRPWGITSAFALWGGKLAEALGVPVLDWALFQAPEFAEKLMGSILQDPTSVMNFGLFLGAFLGAALGGGLRFQDPRRIPMSTLFAVFLGGVLMGYGARLASGCNIGAYLGGIASFSLHGYAWGLAALVGSALGVRFRPLCRLTPEVAGQDLFQRRGTREKGL